MAAQEGHADVVKIIILALEAKADVNKAINGGFTPLFIAANQGRPAVVRILLDANADMNISPNNGPSPLCIAEQNGHAGVVNILRTRRTTAI